MNDLRYALRQLVRAPGFALIAVLSLGLGIGANTAVFSLVNALLFRPVTTLAPDRVLRVYRNEHSPLSWPEFQRLQMAQPGIAQLAGERTLRVGRTDTPVPEALMGSLVVGDLFPLMGARPALGRLYTAADTMPADAATVVISHEYWQSSFAGDPAVLGHAIRINDQSYTIVGVTSPNVGSSLAIWRPAVFFPVPAVTSLIGIRPSEWGGSIYVLARMRPGVSRDQVDAGIRTFGRRLAAEDSARYAGRPGQPPFTTGAASGVTQELRVPVEIGGTFVLALVGLVLLIACANVANLLLARATVRARELGVRAALGARRVRLVRQLLAESAVLALAGGALATMLSVLVAGRVSAWIVSKAPEPVVFDVPVDARVLGYTSLLCAIAVLAFGLLPALRASRPDLAQVLREGARGTDRRGSRLRTLLVGAQVALCTIVLATAALFTRSLAESRHADPGFAADGITDLPVNVETRRLKPDVERAFLEQLLARAEALPGVERATLARTVPLAGSRMERGIALEPGSGGEAAQRMTDFNIVGEGYFATMGIPLLRGRDFGREDRDGAPGTVIVNEAFANRMWPGENALGKRVSVVGAQGPWLTVVGVARDIRYNSLGEDPTPMLYQPWGQNAGGDMVLQVRTAPERARAVAADLQRLLRAADPLLPPVAAVPIAHDMAASLMLPQFGAVLLGGFGVLAMLLASVGIYGITTFAVAQRTREIGIRIALGAARDDVVRLVAARTARPVVFGLAAGLALATGVSILLRAQLYGVGAGDPLALVGTALAIAAVAALAAGAPVRRATRLDPSRALAAE